VIALIAPVTPKAAAPVVVWLFGVVWLFWLRVLLLYIFVLVGAAPKVT
jgi:YggT family protein